MFDTFKATVAEIWDETKAFFKYSETILYARIQTLSGLFTAAIGGVDWTSLFNADFANLIANKTVLYVAAGIFLNGLVTEVLRRRGSSL